MAGFDFPFAVSDSERPLARILLRRVQRTCRHLDVKFRYAGQAGEWWINVDGPLPSMQALIARIASDIRPFVDGYAAGASAPKLRKLGNRFLRHYIEGVALSREQIERTADDIGGTHCSFFFDVGAATHLAGRFSDFSMALIAFHNGRLSGSLIVEEAHTLAEATLKVCLPSDARDGSFAQLVSRAQELKKLSQEEANALIQLKDKRRRSKHQSQRIPAEDAGALVSEAVPVFHALLRPLRQ